MMNCSLFYIIPNDPLTTRQPFGYTIHTLRLGIHFAANREAALNGYSTDQ